MDTKKIIKLILDIASDRDEWKEKAMNMFEKSTYKELEMENVRLVAQLEHDEHNVGKFDDTVSKDTYQVKIKQNMRMWDNCQKLKKEVAHYKKLAEDNFIQSVDDSETSERYEKEVEYWKAQYRIANDLLKPKGCGYMFSEIPNDTDGQEFVDTMKQYFNKNTYSMRVRGQHIKPELRGTGATYFGQNLNESTHMRIYITEKRGE